MSPAGLSAADDGALAAGSPPPIGERLFAVPGKPATIGGIYRGWLNVLLGMVTITVLAGTTAYSFGLFVKPVSEDLGLTRATTNLGLVLYHLGSALYSPVVGRLLDRFSILTIQRVGAALFGGGMVAIGLTSAPLLMGALILGPVALGAAAAGNLFVSVLVSRWFDRLRGRALTIAALGSSFGGMIVFPALGALIQYTSWRTALIVAGVVAWVILSLVSLLARDRPPLSPARAPADPDVAPSVEHVRMGFAEILRLRDFWFISLAVCVLLAVDQALLATVTPLVQDRGFTLPQVAAIMSAATSSAITGKLLIAWVADRFDLRWLFAVTAVCSVVLCFALIARASFAVLFATSCLTGIAMGGTYPIGNAMIARRFGAANVGTAMGLKAPLAGGASMATLYFIGNSFDRFGSYDIGLRGLAGLAALSVVLMPFVRLPRPLATRRAQEEGRS